MNAGRQQDLFDDASGALAGEGAFDAQLSFSTPETGPSDPIRTIVKRNGREEPFDFEKIRHAILRAAHPDDEIDADVAGSLANGVAIYLSKRVRTGPPMAETVAEAVEELLFAMGHNRTGIAYVRYRDRRQRIRRLRDGDVRTFLTELNEARTQSQGKDGGQRAFVVRSLNEGIGEWNRARIVETLKRETDADDATAELVAIAVEKQIQSAGIRTLTAPLVRELVDAQLIAMGRDDLRRRYMRLGVPLYDSEQIICAPNAGEDESSADPETTNGVLAQRVKHEFALNHVFDEVTANAHHDGLIHIHDLGAIDRVHASAQSSGLVTHFGAPLGQGHRRLTAPAYCETAIAHLAQYHHQLAHCHAGRIAWTNLNTWLAALLDETAEWPSRSIAQQLLSQFTQSTMPPSDLHFSWDLPQNTWDQLVLLLPPERAGEYYLFRERMQAFCRTVVEEILLGDVIVNRWNPSRLVFDISPTVFEDMHGRQYAQGLIECALRGAPVAVRITRTQTASVGDRSYWEPDAITAGIVSLNLPQIAYRCRERGQFMAELEQVFTLAVEAHSQKLAFLEKLYALAEAGPLGLLTQRWSGAAYMDLARMIWLTNIVGLNESAEHFFGKGLHESEKAADFAGEVLRKLDALSEDFGKREDFRLAVGQTTTSEARRRFAALDLRNFVEAAPRVKVEGLTQDVSYTAGAQAPFGAKLTPMERLQIESECHRIAAEGAVTTIRIPDIDNQVEGLMDLLQATVRRTAIREIEFVS